MVTGAPVTVSGSCRHTFKKAPVKKPKDYVKLSQKEKFMAAAQEFEADQTGEVFLASFKK